MKEQLIHKIRYLLLLLAFLPAIYFPMFNEAYPLIQKKQTKQAHTEKVLPVFDINRLDKFPRQFNDYYESRLKIKDKLVFLNSIFQIKILNISSINSKVIIGKNGWLFSMGESLKTYQHINSFTCGQMETLRTILRRRAQWAGKQHIKFYVVIAPNKHEIYHEYLPHYIEKLPQPGRTDQLLSYMKNDTDVFIIDLRKVLLRNKGTIPLYFKTDSHWNYLGGYYAYTEIINRLRKDFPFICAPLKLQNFKIDSSEVAAGGESVLINMEEWYYENRINLKPLFREKAVDGKRMNYKCPEKFSYPWDYEIDKEVKNDSLPTAVIIRDSFTDYLVQYLKEHFKRSVFIFDRWMLKENKNIVENEKPDIVLLIMNDNGFDNLIEYDSEK